MKWKINTLEYTNDNDKGVVTAHWDVTLLEGEFSACQNTLLIDSKLDWSVITHPIECAIYRLRTSI